MPVIVPKQVVSCTSEDKVQCAENLLKPETYRKWRTSTTGEGQAVVVLEFAKAVEIHSIDVGNEGSTFVEILVGDAAAGAKVDFNVLLGASAFMTPAEAKGWTNVNKVRFFGPDKLNRAVREKKWTRVMIVATQNFNKNQAFGLAFLKFHSPPEKGGSDGAGNGEPETKKFGAFAVKQGTMSPSPIMAGSLFDRVKREPESTPPPGAAALRLAPTGPVSISPKPTGLFQFKRRSEDVKPGRLETDAHQTSVKMEVPVKIEAISPRAPVKIEASSPRLPAKTEVASQRAPVKIETSYSGTPSKPVQARPTTQNSAPRKRPSSPSSTPSSVKKKKMTRPPAPFPELLKGVTFALSGYQNPLRGQIRDHALEMGAKYKGDWDPSCTHLVCAFSNTPKFQQVLGKGKIVTKRWIETCYKERRRQPWRDFRLDDGSSGSDSDDDGDHKSTSKSKQPVKNTETKTKTNNGSNLRNADNLLESTRDEDDVYDDTTDVDSDVDAQGRRPGLTDDGDPDTEEELERAMTGKRPKDEPKPAKVDETKLPPLPHLPEFFASKRFLLYGTFDDRLRKQTKRFIIGYGGSICAYMSSTVDFVVTRSSWGPDFDDAIEENPTTNFVKPKWIRVCHEKGKLVPYQAYVVAPPEDDD